MNQIGSILYAPTVLFSFRGAGYQLEEKLGESTSGTEVYKAICRAPQEHEVATIKLFESSSEYKGYDAFGTQTKLDHPNIAQPYRRGWLLARPALGDIGFYPAVITEYMEETLVERIRTQGLPVEQAHDVASQLLDATSYMHHQGVVHLDLKLDNLMFKHQDQSFSRLKVSDFGCSVKVGTEVSTPRGTVTHAAPEQFLPGERTTEQDVYALGIVLTQLFTGESPVDTSGCVTSRDFYNAHCNQSPRSLETILRTQGVDESAIPAVFRKLQPVIDRCLEKDPTKRYKDASEVLEAYERVWRVGKMRARTSRKGEMYRGIEQDFASCPTSVLEAAPTTQLLTTTILDAEEQEEVFSFESQPSRRRVNRVATLAIQVFFAFALILGVDGSSFESEQVSAEHDYYFDGTYDATINT